MRKSWLLCVLLGTLAWGQAAPSEPPSAQPTTPDTAASVPPTAAVITIIGVCPAQTQAAATKGTAAKTATKASAEKTPAADCKTVITKAQFEKLADALAPNVTPQLKRQLAGLLPRMIAMSDAAKKQGIDKTPQYAETLKFVKMQVLANDLQRKIQKEAADVPPAEIEAYYKQNPEAYEQYTVERLFVPRTKQNDNEVKAEDEDKDKDQKMTDDEKKAKEAAEKAKAEENEQSMTKLAEDLRDRAAKGEDFTKLQKEAFEAAGMKIESPTVNLPNLRRTGLPPTHASVFDLKPGEVSQVISDAGGHYIYKIVSKNEMPFDQAKNEIHSKLQNDRMRDMMENVNNSFKTETNEAYFGPGGAGPLPPPHMPRPRPGMPPARSSQPQTPPPAAKPN
ncbi:MAG TPA: peptidyl-prolyl cis-trans isomerase [Candidatus Sulfotelmatobacter sp.]|nr:peptidyl-prolyl cis-trans isomerase [Candidatus Sulfotelmatobacter sp.]